MKNKKIDVKTKIGYAIIVVIFILLIVIIVCLKSINYNIEDFSSFHENEYNTTFDETSIINAVNKTNNMKDLSGVLKIESVSMWTTNGEKSKEIKLPAQDNTFENEYEPELKGKIINKTKNMYTDIEIKYNLYDEDNNIIGVLHASADLKGGETANIEAFDIGDVRTDYNKIHHFKLASIKGIEYK